MIEMDNKPSGVLKWWLEYLAIEQICIYSRILQHSRQKLTKHLLKLLPKYRYVFAKVLTLQRACAESTTLQ